VIEEQSTTFSPNILGSKVFKSPTIFDTRPLWSRVAWGERGHRAAQAVCASMSAGECSVIKLDLKNAKKMFK